MPIVHFPRHLIHQLSVPSTFRAEGSTVEEVLAGLERQFPGLRDYVVDDQGGLRPHVNIFIGEQWIRDRKNLSDRVAAADEITVVQALAGG